MIDGQGQAWWDFYLAHGGRSSPTNRSRLIYFNRVKNAQLENITLTNSPSFHFVPHASENIAVDGIKIIAPANSPNTDGIDPSNTRDMTIHHCLIDTGDDNIAIKAGSIDPRHPQAAVENITVSDCTFRAGHGASIGTETVGGIRNVIFERIHFIGTDNAVRIKSSRGRGGEVSNVTYRDLTLENVRNAILLTAYYPKIPTNDTGRPPIATTPYYHDITLQNIHGNSRNPGAIAATPEKPFRAIRLENVQLQTNAALPVRNTTLTAKDVQIGAGASAFQLEDQADVGP